MAMLLRSDGGREIVVPANGWTFTLEELQTLVGGCIKFAPTTEDDMLMAVDEEGKYKGKPPNVEATLLYKYSSQDGIVGEAVVGTVEEFGDMAAVAA